ncbi:hypothetical protein EMIHUDRAFT_245760 [Emiliania huxleyi CCMP1516]|uniref:Uncharacterized protein n=2 Tax=Emiliania huxleyi TaxID=2903 RepID=A0A0D3IWA0_EMIH1|nr:hypothetical protein EMIHUDRAFT_245760 [Emiliania huxleyi CCMP1516]EOD15535.1 hypothetical protein EMIHUDRAFT_245760 [Emiliania huxleyi CCMP1516]|eukprot:XP_005767964.1 hypothetical protein EMIHUDRAFT_245760 [Emiliania huxleyi CCMP1516]
MLRRAFGSEKQVDPSDDDDRSRRLRYRCRATNVLTIVYLLSLLLIALALSLADAEKQRQSLAGKRYGNPAIRLDIPWSEPKARFPATDRLKAADEEGTYDELEKLRIAKRIRKLREQRRKSDREARMNEDGDENSAYHYL